MNRQINTVLAASMCVFAISACTSDDASSQAPPPSDHDRANVAIAHDIDGGDARRDRWPGEAGLLADTVQLTFPDRFIKAGESYFSPDDSKIIFQAVETVADGAEPEAYYQMYVADVVRNGAGNITGLNNYKQLSPSGSSNTCGWFHPTKPNTVIFGSTIVAPTTPEAAGYQRGTGRYAWQFPKEMKIVQCDVTKADGTADTIETLVDDPSAYLAECSITRDGRHLLYCSFREADAEAGGDLYVKDFKTGAVKVLVNAPGYDGGPFFSPDEKWICYRSDRRNDRQLQIFIAELDYDADGAIVGLKREVPVTNNEHVNWAPFWDGSSRYLIYTTSEQGHRNYEVYSIDTYPARESTAAAAELTKRRITAADKFDGLPVFNSDGTLMMWTSQRDATGSSQLWVARFVMNLAEAG